MQGTVSIPNPRPMTLTMGNVTFNPYIHATKTLIEDSTLSNLVLRSSNNTVQMKAIVDQAIVITQLSTNFEDGILSVDIVDKSVVYKREHLPYLEKALAGNKPDDHIICG